MESIGSLQVKLITWNGWKIKLIIMGSIGMSKIGYVANSCFTVIGDSMSAGRLWDKISDKTSARVVLVTPKGILCKVSQKSLVTLQVSE